MNDDQKKAPGRPRKAAAHRAADRDRLVSAAFDIVREGGSSALTVRSVATRVGTAVGSVYAAFDNLDALHLEVNALTMGLLERHLAGALIQCPGDSLQARLSCLAGAYIGFADANRPIWSALFEPRTSSAPPVVTAHISGLFSLLEGVLRGSGSDEDDVRLLARALWSSVHGMVYLAETGGLGPVGREEALPMVEALIRAVVDGLERRSL